MSSKETRLRRLEAAQPETAEVSQIFLLGRDDDGVSVCIADFTTDDPERSMAGKWFKGSGHERVEITHDEAMRHYELRAR